MQKNRLKRALAISCTAVMIAAGSFNTCFTALAEGNTGTAATVSGDLTTDWWTGYVNQDGSTYTYIEKGTEVSKFQNLDGDIDWQAARADGLDFVMIRLAYGTTQDPYFYENIKGAQAAGIKVGVYLCSTAQNLEQTIAETQLTLQMLQGYSLQYPVAYDVEVNSMLAGGATADDMTQMIDYYCKAMVQAGYTPIIYANKTWLTTHMNLSQLPYDVWYASYPSDKVYRPVSGANTTIWQSSEKGTVNGIKGKVTTEFSVKSYGGYYGATHGNASSVQAGTAVSGSTSAGTSSTGTATIGATTGTAGTAGTTGTSSTGTVISNYGPVKGTDTTQQTVVGATSTPVTTDGSVSTVIPETTSKNGWVYENNNYSYYITGFKQYGLVDVDGKTYYLGTDGAMHAGWQEISGSKYYFNESGYMVKGTTIAIGGQNYTFDANGVLVG